MIFTFLFFIWVAYKLYIWLLRKTARPNFLGQTIWITGASSGIGQSLAYEFNRCGASLIISARNVNQLNRVKGKCSDPSKVTIVPMDMTKFQQVQKITAETLNKLEKSGSAIDILVENAGVSMRSPFVDYSLENHISMFDLNVHGPFCHIQAVLPHMIKNKRGKIVGITSVTGKLSPAFRSSYAASKHAFIGLLDSIRSQVAQYGIRVCNVMPGYVKTNVAINALTSGAGQKFGRQDSNISKGMEASACAHQTVCAIYNNQNEVEVSEKQWNATIGIWMRNLLPSAVFFGLKMNARQQAAALKEE